MNFTNIYTQGSKDKNGVPYECTEARMALALPGMKKVLLGTGRWEDTTVGYGQILRYDPAEDWVVEYNGVPGQQVISCLAQVHFPKTGAYIEVASTWGSNKTFVLVRDNKTQTWTQTVIATGQGGAQIRAFGSHTDYVTGIDHVFAGQEPAGIFSGTYDGAAIIWNPKPELPSPSAYRPMAFATLFGILYVTIGEDIYRRVDGPNATWVLETTNPNPGITNPPLGGLRGMIASPFGGTLWTCNTGSNAGVYSYDPKSKMWATLYQLKGGGLIGYNAINYINGIVYIGCQHVGAQILTLTNGIWAMLSVPSLSGNPLVAVRSIAQSPFDPHVLFLTGYDCDGKPAHRSGWVYLGAP